VGSFFQKLFLAVLGRNAMVRCKDTEMSELLLANYGEMRQERGSADLHYTVGRQGESSAFFLTREGQEPLVASDDSEFLFLFEKGLTIDLQKLRSDLFFIHGAAIEFLGKAFMLVGPSGSGKSTTTWALLHHGFRYLSDELGPVDLESIHILTPSALSVSLQTHTHCLTRPSAPLELFMYR
jgi:hypothetical protein